MIEPISMQGFMDRSISSIDATRILVSDAGYDEKGIWVDGEETPMPGYSVNLQPLSDGREIQALNIGGERIDDHRVMHINAGDVFGINRSEFWEMKANGNRVQRFKVIAADVRDNSDDNDWSRYYARLVICVLNEYEVTQDD